MSLLYFKFEKLLNNSFPLEETIITITLNLL